MRRLIRQSQNFFSINHAIVPILNELLQLELTSIIRFKFYEITTTGIFHDAIVPNFAKIVQDDQHHAWELAMLISSYGAKPILEPMQIDNFATIKDFLFAVIDIKKSLIEKYTIIKNQMDDPDSGVYDPAGCCVIEEIMAEERMNMSELIKLSDQSSLIGL